MPALTLSACLSRNPMTAPLLSGEVVPEAVDWAVSGIHPSEMFWRQLKFADFDVSEMSLASLSIAASKGVRDWVALPVFTTRRFFHTAILVRDGADIDQPADLVGKRVGVPEYQQTAAVWSRGALLHEFGVAPEQLRWYMERPPARSHGGSTSFRPPSGVELSYIPTDTSMDDLLAAGELDAALVYLADRNLVDRSRRAADAVPGLRPLFADPAREGARYYRATGILPVNHCVVVRAAILEKHPWLALNLYSAFLAAKTAATSPLPGLLEPWAQIGALPPDVSGTLHGIDPLPYGIQGQLAVFDALADFLSEQGLVDQRVGVEDLFAPSTLDL